MSQQFYDFKKGKPFDPLAKVKEFFINPLNPKSALRLHLKAKSALSGLKESRMGFYEDLPMNIFPLSVLGLEQCMVQWASPKHGIIFTDTKFIIFSLHEDMMMIDRVLEIKYGL